MSRNRCSRGKSRAASIHADWTTVWGGLVQLFRGGFPFPLNMVAKLAMAVRFDASASRMLISHLLPLLLIPRSVCRHVPQEAPLLRGCCCCYCQRIECASQGVDSRVRLVAKPMPPREPPGVVVGKPGAARFILPNKCLQRQ